MKIPLNDLTAQYDTIKDEIDEAIRNVLRSGQFILGPNVAALEREVADYLGVRYAVGVASGTDALILALRALGVGPGDEVIMPAFTFFATAEAVMQLGATPVFVDITLDTYCLDVDQVAERITPRTRVVIPVHLYGQPANMAPLQALAEAHGLKIVEDNAQAFGAEYRGRKTGALGDVGCQSFFPSKNLGAYGDGGMITTDDAEVAERVRMLRTHGWRNKYYPEIIGYNSRLDEIQAAILRAKLPHIDAWNERRRQLAERYHQLLAGLDISVPSEAADSRHVYHAYVIRSSQRDRIREHLTSQGIGTALYYPEPLHRLKPCEELQPTWSEGDFGLSDQASREALSIPLYPEMPEEQMRSVVTALEKAVPLSV